MVDRLRSEYQGRVDFKLFDLDKDAEGRRLADSYGATFVPTFVFLNSDGSKAAQLVGVIDERAFRAKLDSLK